MQQLTKEDIQNMLALISKATISGAEALVVAQLQQKLTLMAVDATSVTESKTVFAAADNKTKKDD